MPRFSCVVFFSLYLQVSLSSNQPDSHIHSRVSIAYIAPPTVQEGLCSNTLILFYVYHIFFALTGHPSLLDLRPRLRDRPPLAVSDLSRLPPTPRLCIRLWVYHAIPPTLHRCRYHIFRFCVFHGSFERAGLPAPVAFPARDRRGDAIAERTRGG